MWCVVLIFIVDQMVGGDLNQTDPKKKGHPTDAGHFWLTQQRVGGRNSRLLTAATAV